MSNPNKFTDWSRRGFTRVLAASVAGAPAAVPALLAQQNSQTPNSPAPPSDPTRPAPGNFRRPMVPDAPPFEGPLEFTRKDIPPRVEPC